MSQIPPERSVLILIRRHLLQRVRSAWLAALAGIFACIVLGAVPLLKAANPVGQPIDRLEFSRIEQSEDFPSIAVISLAQDALGFLWVGTRDGLLRYDGVEFKEYRHDRDDPYSLSDNFIERLHVDGDGSLWIGLSRGLCRYDVLMDRFIRYLPGGENVAVKGFGRDRRGRLLALAESGLILEYRAASDRFEPVSERFGGALKTMLVDRDGSVWIGGTESVMRLDEELRPVRTFDLPSEMAGQPNSFANALAELKDGRVVFGTIGFGVWAVDQANGKVEPFGYTSERARVIGTLMVDAAGTLFIGSTEGLTVVDSDTEEVHRYSYSEYDSRSLQDGTVYALFIDSQGNLWTGTSRGGLAVAYNRKAFEVLRHSALDTESLTKDKVTSLLEDSQGRIWVGYHNDGLDIIDEAAGRKTYLDPYAGGSVGKGSIFDFWEDAEGYVWVAANWSGLQRIDHATGRVERFEPDAEKPGTIRGSDVRGITPDGEGNFWLALHGVGVDYYDRSTGEFVPLTGFPHLWVEDIALADDGGLWIGYSDGLSYLPPRSSVFKEYRQREGQGEGLSDRQVKCLLVDTHRRVWVGTKHGLDRINPETGGIEHFYAVDGLPSLDIRSLIQDDGGAVWVATARGLAIYVEGTGRFETFDKTDGLATNEMVERSATKMRDGRLLFGSERGIVRFAPTAIRNNTIAPEVVLTGVKLYSNHLAISDEPGAILPRSPMALETIVFPAGRNSFGFEFAALNFIAPETNRYAYKLEGFDVDWIDNGTRRDCSYTNIPPGTYTFRVKASNNDGIWNEAGRSLLVVVEPYYWQTLWFKGLVISILALGAVVVYKLRVSGLARQKEVLEETVVDRTQILQHALEELETQKRCIEDQNLELQDHRENLEQLVAQRTEELEAARDKAEVSERLKSSFLENVSHEIRTPMNAIIGFLNILRCKNVTESEQQDYHRIIERSGKSLLTLIDDILDLSRMETEELVLVRERVNISDLFNALETYYREVAGAERPEIEIRLDLDPYTPLPLVIWTDEGRLQQIVNNLLDNALKFTERGSIRFCYRTRDEADGKATLEIEVSDTGIGIPEDKIDQIWDRFRKLEGNRQKLYRGTGLGLAIVRRLLEAFGGEVRVNSTVGHGTKFIVTLPVEMGEDL